MRRTVRTGFLRTASCLALAAASTTGWATCAAIAAPSPDSAPPTQAAQVQQETGAAVRATLANGLRVVIVPDRLAPVVTTEINYLAGSNDAPSGFPGTAHALEHMMFRGSAGLDRDQLAELGAALGGSYNADTTETVTQYFYTVPAEDLAVSLRIEALRMRGLSLNQADWDKERGAIEQEVARDLSSPIYSYLEQLQAIMFAGTPYEHDALGTRPSFDKTDANLLRAFYEKWYAPNNAILVIVGDVDAPRALAQVTAAFGDIPRRVIPRTQPWHRSRWCRKPLPCRPISRSAWPPSPTACPASAATISPPPTCCPTSSAASARHSTAGPGRRALFAEFEYLPKADAGYAVAAAGFPTGGDPAPLLSDMRRIIADTAAHGVSAELLEAARRQELAQLAFQHDSIAGLAESWSKALAFQGANSPDDVAHAYQAATLADVNRLARTLLTPDHAVTAILTPENAGAPIAGHGFGGAESFGTPPEKPVALPDWATAALDKLDVPPAAPPPYVTILPNGLRLIVQPEHVGHTISVYGQVRQNTDMQEPADREGIGEIASNLFSYGTQSQDRLTFQKSLDDIAAQEEAGASFSLKVLTPQFEAGMKLLADNELHPAFPPRAFEIVRRQVAQGLAGELKSPDYRFKRAITKALVPPATPPCVRPRRRASCRSRSMTCTDSMLPPIAPTSPPSWSPAT